MNLTIEKFQYLWKNREKIFSDSKALINRFDEIGKLFDKIANYELKIENDDIAIDGVSIYKEPKKPLSLGYFGCFDDGFTAGSALAGVERLKTDCIDTTFHELIDQISHLLGGFEFHTTQMKSEYRLLSCKETANDDYFNDYLPDRGIVKKVSSNFADNNYFFWFVKTIQDIKNNSFDPNQSHIALMAPNKEHYQGMEPEDIIKAQREALNNRFPYKFFYMWAHKDEVIHPIGLLAYKKFICQEETEFQYQNDLRMNQPFSDFKNQWKNYSDKIIHLIPEEDRGDDPVKFNSDLSKLISIIMINDQDIKNIRDLVETGNQAIILWGPPGTGKTYQANELVCQMLETNLEDLEKVRFSKIEDFSSDSFKGCYEIVQFHPNYSYEDFIGGIAPKLDGSNLSYTLKEGVFKKFCDKATKSKKPFIFIIDEINRADLSAVFGELLYALEYRGKSINIPNFTEPFVIPQNVYIVGTMNNVDKSLVSFDLALRRRFGFFKVMPNINVLSSELADIVNEKNLEAYVGRCRKLNSDITNNQQLGLSDDYQIGHAYFLKIKDFIAKATQKSPGNDDDNSLVEISTFDLEKLWAYHILPLLEEYLGNKTSDPAIKKKIENIKIEFTKALA